MDEVSNNLNLHNYNYVHFLNLVTNRTTFPFHNNKKERDFNVLHIL